MLTTIKKRITKKLPNCAGLMRYYKLKKATEERTNMVVKLDESEYPSYLKTFYMKRTGHQLNLENPERFTEKVQWRKLNDKDDIYSLLSDKYLVKEWVRNKIGDEFLIPSLGCWRHFNEIDFDSLPEKFVLKTNNGCHANMIVEKKDDFLRGKWAARKIMEYWLKSIDYYDGLELHYKKISPMIIAEKYIEHEIGEKCLTDYKFHCFNGVPFVCEVIEGRTTNETVNYYDMDWKHLQIKNPPYPTTALNKNKPQYYELMIKLARELSQGFQYVRVDLYNADRVYFGEMTFTPANGVDKYEPDEWDYEMGKLWDVSSIQIDHCIVMGNSTLCKK